MVVYIVMKHIYFSCDFIVGVYSTKELAEEYTSTLKYNVQEECYEISSHEVL